MPPFAIRCPQCGFVGSPSEYDTNPGGHCCPECGYQGEPNNDSSQIAWEDQFDDG